MELKVFKDTLMAAGGSFDAKAELPVEAEILIPDYLPQVFKIVKCFVHLLFRWSFNDDFAAFHLDNHIFVKCSG